MRSWMRMSKPYVKDGTVYTDLSVNTRSPRFWFWVLRQWWKS
jgi:hypothetical protein